MRYLIMGIIGLIIIFTPVILIGIVIVRITCNYLAKRIAEELRSEYEKIKFEEERYFEEP